MRLQLFSAEPAAFGSDSSDYYCSRLAWAMEQDYAALSEILPQLETVFPAHRLWVIGHKQSLRTPAVTSFLPSEVQPGCSRDSADDSWQNCVRSVSCQLTMRQWGLTEYKLCSSVWGYISWHETITHHPTPLPFIKKKTKKTLQLLWLFLLSQTLSFPGN